MWVGGWLRAGEEAAKQTARAVGDLLRTTEVHKMGGIWHV